MYWMQSLGDYGFLEGTAFPVLKSCGKAMEQDDCFPDVFCDSSDASANFLCHLYGHLIPCTSCLHSKRTEEMYFARSGILVCLLCYLRATVPDVVAVLLST